MIEVKVTYTANAGVMIQINENAVLLDALSHDHDLVYAQTPETLASQIINGLPPFERIDAILYTHLHRDHFSASLTEQFMAKHTKSKLFIGNHVIETLKSNVRFQLALRSENVILLKQDLETHNDTNAFTIVAIKTKHMGEEFSSVQHYMYHIEMGGVTILFLGDTEPMADNFKYLETLGKGIDVLVAPFPYLSTTNGLLFVKEIIKPKHVVTVHLPPREKDTYHWYEATLKMYNRKLAQEVPATFALELGHTYTFSI